MDLVKHAESAGGATRWAEIVRRWGRTAVERAIASGEIERAGRGRYVVRGTAPERKAAVMTGGIVSMRSAARLHGWGQKRVPVLPDITYPRTRHISPAERRLVVPHWSDLPDSDVVNGVTSVRRTLIDCMRMLPLDESLPIVESALREGSITDAGLRRLADGMRGRGRTRARGVAELASRRTANAFESVLHALVSTVPGLRARPQLLVGRVKNRDQYADFVDPALGIVIEAEGFEWHGKPAALDRDCKRYNGFVNRGWLVVRFSWRQVMFEQAYVLGVLARAVEQARHRHANVA